MTPTPQETVRRLVLEHGRWCVKNNVDERSCLAVARLEEVVAAAIERARRDALAEAASVVDSVRTTPARKEKLFVLASIIRALVGKGEQK